MATTRTVDPVYLPFVILTPPGTLAAAPLITPLPVIHGMLEVVDVAIPPGHNALTGIALRSSGQIILPYFGVDPWIIGDNLQEQFQVGTEVGQNMTAATYNLGVYEHRHYLRLRIRQNTGPTAAAPVELVPLSTLNAGN